MGLLFGLVTPVFAIGNPTSVNILEAAVFTGLWETGDRLVYIRYNVDYSPVPTEDASDTWLAMWINGAGTPVVRPLNYYQHNIISIYLTAAQVTTYTFTWGTNYWIRVSGSPSIFTLVEGTNMRTTMLVVGDYKSLSDAGVYFLGQAQILENSWGIDLVGSYGKLNTTGSTYFREAIPNLEDALPEIFTEIVDIPTATRGNFTKAGQTSFASHTGPNLSAAMTAIGTWLGTTGGWMGFYSMIMVMGVFAAGMFAATKIPVAGLFGAVAILGLWAYLGLGSDLLVALGAVATVVAILFGVVFIMGRFK